MPPRGASGAYGGAMSVEYLPGGRRRVDRVLDPTFCDDVASLDDATLHERREDVQQEEVDLSYLRRLLHGRLDLLVDERAHRSGERPPPAQGPARTDAELVEVLSRVLADDARTTRGSGRFLTVEPSRVGEHRRTAERAVADLRLATPARLDDAALAQAIARLREVERTVSDTRRAVQEVEQRLTDELTRRVSAAQV